VIPALVDVKAECAFLPEKAVGVVTGGSKGPSQESTVKLRPIANQLRARTNLEREIGQTPRG